MAIPQNLKHDTALGSRLDKLVAFSKSAEWDDVCDWAEGNFPELHDHMETWGANCGAPRAVYRGHLVRMLIDIIGNDHGYKEILHILSGVVYRMNDRGYMKIECYDEEEEGQVEHWEMLMHQAIDDYRKKLAEECNNG